MALRIRQQLPDAGGAVLVTPVRDDELPAQLVLDLSRHMSYCDERILILDARIMDGDRDRADGSASPSIETPRPLRLNNQPGLVQYLRFHAVDDAQCIVPTEIPGVDYLPAGGPTDRVEILNTQRMSELVQELEKRYTLIFILGPSMGHAVLGETLAAHAQAVILVLNDDLDGLRQAVPFTNQLRDASAPLLGAVVGA